MTENENQAPAHVNSPDFQHGYTNGLEQIKKDTYEGYLAACISVEWLNDQINTNQQIIRDLDLKITQNKNQNKIVFDGLQTQLLHLNLASKEQQRLGVALDAKQKLIQFYEEKYRQSASNYSLLAGLLYLVAGLSFVFGDLIISHEIVAYALNIRNDFEAWAFAVGLAMVSVLLKPAYERLVEKPYLDGSLKGRRFYAWFKGGLVLFSVLTLFILGWFRYQAYKTDKLKEGINKTIKNIQLQQGDLSLTPENQTNILTQLNAQLQKIEVLNQNLVLSNWALASFVLSGILFALAGAVCLGIALPVLAAYWTRWLQVAPKLKTLRKQKTVLETELKNIDEQLANCIIQKNIAENDLALLENIQILQGKRETILEHINGLKDEAKLQETDIRLYTYNDGYAKGAVARDVLTEEEWAEFRKNNYLTVSNLALKAKGDTGERAVNFSKKNNNLRPHQAIRKIIAEQFESETNE